MPIRQTQLENGEYYHIIVRVNWQTPIFQDLFLAKLLEEVLIYYTLAHPPLKFSLYRNLKDKTAVQLDFKDRLATIIAYCIMPTHIHLLLRQEKDKGIEVFMHKSLTSFSHYYNIKFKKVGSLFENRFKAIHIDEDEHLVHLSRYIHLNPVTAGIVEDPRDYRFSSYEFYLKGESQPPFEITEVMAFFKDPQDYHSYVMERKEFQRELAKVKYLLID